MGASFTDRRDEAEESPYRSHLWPRDTRSLQRVGCPELAAGQGGHRSTSLVHGPHGQPEDLG